MAQYFFSAAKIQQKKHIRKFLAVNFVFAERLACLNGKIIYYSRINLIKRRDIRNNQRQRKGCL